MQEGQIFKNNKIITSFLVTWFSQIKINFNYVNQKTVYKF